MMPRRLTTMLAPTLPLLLVAALMPTPAWAQADTPELGRLFYSPERRAALDRQRTLNIQTVRTEQGETLRLDGIVRRSSGKQTVWLNGRPQHESGEAESGVGVDVHPAQPGRATIHAGEDSATRLRVGEAVNRSTGELETRLNGGRVVIHKAR